MLKLLRVWYFVTAVALLIQILVPRSVVCSNQYLKMWQLLWNWVMGRGWRSLEVHAREHLDCLEKTVGRNVDIKGDLGESSEKRREQ